MGLADRVEFWRARKTGDVVRQPTVQPEPELLIPPRFIRQLAYHRPREDAEGARDILTAFGVEDRLAEIQSKYWGYGNLYTISNGYVLGMSYNEVERLIKVETHHPATLPKTYSHYRSDMPEKGWGYGGLQIDGHSPGSPEYTTTQTHALYREVRHSIFAVVGKLQRPEGSNQTQNELALFVAIGIEPDLFLRGNSLKAFELYPYFDPDLTKIQEATLKLGSGKYIPETYSPIKVFSISDLQYSRDYRKYNIFNSNPRSNPRDYVTKPFAPWDIFAKSSNPAELDDFLAEYIVDADLDQKSIRQAISEAKSFEEVYKY